MAEFDIIRKGFARPYIIFQFEDGTTIDTSPPRYFQSFEQTRTCDAACEFRLTLTYVPGNFGDTTASLMHQILLNKVNTRVTYKYGFLTADSPVPVFQNQAYSGILLKYEESISDTSLQYTLSGTASVVNLTSETIAIQDFMEEAKKHYKGTRVQPSTLVGILVNSTASDLARRVDSLKGLQYGDTSTYGQIAVAQHALRQKAFETTIPELLSNYEKEIVRIDEAINIQEMKISDGTIHDIFGGKSNSDGSSSPDCFAYHSYISTPADKILNTLSEYTLSSDEIRQLNDIAITNRYSSQAYSDALSAASDTVRNLITTKTKYIAYFDNVVSDIGSNLKGTFHYVPEKSPFVSDAFTFDFGNSIIESVVLSFDTNYDCSVAYAALAGLDNENVNIDVDGEPIGGNYVTSQTGDFKKNSYPTLSGFNEETFISETLIGRALAFPYEATMKIIGELNCHSLLDVIHINVFVNGVPHLGMTGDYIIKGISDSLDTSGFTTTFNLLRDAYGTEYEQPEKMTVSDKSDAASNDAALKETNT